MMCSFLFTTCQSQLSTLYNTHWRVIVISLLLCWVSHEHSGGQRAEESWRTTETSFPTTATLWGNIVSRCTLKGSSWIVLIAYLSLFPGVPTHVGHSTRDRQSRLGQLDEVLLHMSCHLHVYSQWHCIYNSGHFRMVRFRALNLKIKTAKLLCALGSYQECYVTILSCTDI